MGTTTHTSVWSLIRLRINGKSRCTHHYQDLVLPCHNNSECRGSSLSLSLNSSSLREDCLGQLPLVKFLMMTHFTRTNNSVSTKANLSSRTYRGSEKTEMYRSYSLIGSPTVVRLSKGERSRFWTRGVHSLASILSTKANQKEISWVKSSQSYSSFCATQLRSWHRWSRHCSCNSRYSQQRLLWKKESLMPGTACMHSSTHWSIR